LAEGDEAYSLNFGLLQVTDLCNLKCIHCYDDAKYDSKDFNILCVDDAIYAMDELVYDIGVLMIVINGCAAKCPPPIVRSLRIKTIDPACKGGI